MNYCCGGIIYNPVYNSILIVHQRYSKKWGVPKGHIKKNETYAECAKREIFEEIGIKFNITDKDRYIKIKNKYKNYILFPLIYNNEKITINDDTEIKNFKWINIFDINNKDKKYNFTLKMLPKVTYKLLCIVKRNNFLMKIKDDDNIVSCF